LACSDKCIAFFPAVYAENIELIRQMAADPEYEHTEVEIITLLFHDWLDNMWVDIIKSERDAWEDQFSDSNPDPDDDSSMKD